MNRNVFYRCLAAGLALVLAIPVLVLTTGCVTSLSSGPVTPDGYRRLNPTAYAQTDDNVTVVVGTELVRRSNSDEIFPLMVIVRNGSTGVIHVDAANFYIRDELGNEYPPVEPTSLAGMYTRVNFDYELARTSEFIGLLNESVINLETNFYPHRSNKIVIGRHDMRTNSRILDMLYYQIPGWRDMDGTLTMVVKNLRDRPPLEVKFTLAQK